MPCTAAFDGNDATEWDSLGTPVTGQFAASDYGSEQSAAQWRILQSENVDNAATSVRVWGTNDPDLFADLDGAAISYDFSGAGWSNLEDLTLSAGENSGLFATTYSYQYFAFEALAGGDEAWLVQTIALAGTDQFCGHECEHMTHGADVVLPDGQTLVEALAALPAVPAAPGGELGGTWASPTVDATHAGSTHSAASDTHVADTSAAHAASSIGFTPNGSIAATDVQAAIQEVRDEAAGGGAPSTADYLVGTANGGLSAEIVVGTTPGGELGGTWASPTVDATHSGSTHSAASDTHVADTSAAHVASSIGFTPVGTIAATDVQAAIAEVASEAGSGGTVLACSLSDATFTPASGAEVAIPFDTEDRDDGGFFTGGAPTRLTVPSTGWHVITGYFATVGTTNVDSLIAAIRLNGTTYLALNRDYETTNAIGRYLNVSAIAYLTATDYVELTIAFAAEAVTSRFAIARVGLS